MIRNRNNLKQVNGGDRLGDISSLVNAIINNNCSTSAYAITAIGDSQTTAIQLLDVINEVDNSTIGSGVALPASTGNFNTPFQICIIINNSPNTIQVYSNYYSSDSINGTAGNIGISQPAGITSLYVSSQNGNWFDISGIGNGGIAPGPAGTVVTSTGTGFISAPINVGNEPVGLLFPAYIYPSGGDLAYYTTFISNMATYPNVPCVIIQNPDNGPGVMFDSNYGANILRLQAAGATVIGYIYTLVGQRPIGDVEADIDTWISLYSTIQGLFLDQMDTDPAGITYYENIKTYANARNLNLIIGNSGINTTAGYFSNPTANAIVVYENIDAYPTVTLATNNGEGTRFQRCAIATHVPYDATGFGIMTQNCQYVWATDFTNNYAQIPTYITTLFQVLSALATATAVTGILKVLNGGWGLDTLPQNEIPLGNGVNPPTFIAPSNVGNLITDTGTTFISAPPVGIGNFLPVGLIFPAFIYPPDTFYSTLISTMPSYPNVPVTIILGPPASGGADPNYTTLISQLQAAGIVVVLAVDTAFGATAIATVKANISILVGYYPTVNGIAVDSMSTSPTEISYYATIKTYINGLGYNFVIGIPGAITDAGYFAGTTADLIIVASNSGTYPTLTEVTNNGLGTKAQRAALAFNVAYNSTDFALMAQNCSFVMATDSTDGSVLPTYLTTLFAVLEALDTSPALKIPAMTMVGNPNAYTSNAIPIAGFYTDTHGHIISTVRGTPTIVAGTGAGTSPTVAIIGGDVNGVINITTGSGSPATAATIATITFGNSYSTAPKTIIITSANAVTAALTAAAPFPASIGTGSWVLKSNGTALATATAYSWNYLVIG